MKKNIIILFTSMIGICGIAQNSSRLTKSCNAYRAADKMVKRQVEFKDQGSSGRNLTWDFSMIQAVNEEYPLRYFIPDSSKMEYLCGLEHKTRYYFRQQQDSLHAVGYENSTTYMQYTKPELRMHFPFSYGDTLYSTFEGKGEYCHRLPLTVKGYTRIKADAIGDLILPEMKTVKNALRVRTLRHYTETGKDSLEMTLDTYSWYANGIRYPVFESIKTTLNKKGDRKDINGESMNDTTVFSTSFYYPPDKQVAEIQTDSIPPDNSGTNDINTVFTEAKLMPNPVINDLHINFKLTRDAKVWFTLHNNAGVPMCQTTAVNYNQGTNNTTVDMKNMIKGIYTLYVHVDDMVVSMNVVKK